jgi:hypothetical protein
LNSWDSVKIDTSILSPLCAEEENLKEGGKEITPQVRDRERNSF